MTRSEPAERVARWLDTVVIGLGLCPFAGPVRGSLRIAVSAAETAEAAVRDALAEAARLIDTPQIPTTIVAFPGALADFETYLDAMAALQDLLNDAGADGVLQVATFHPDYRFADAPDDDLGHFTNRAPYPLAHLLREHDVSEALDSVDDPAAIPLANAARMRDLGPAAIARLWATFTDADTP